MRMRLPRRNPERVKLTVEELADERICAEHLCFLCLEVVPKLEGIHWRVSAEQHLILHPACHRRALFRLRDRIDAEPLRGLLPLLRDMRPSQKEVSNE